MSSAPRIDELTTLKEAWKARPDPLDWFVFRRTVMTRNYPGQAGDEMMDRFFDTLLEVKPTLIVSLAFGTVVLAPEKRKILGNILRELEVPAVVISDDLMTRGAVTALSWVGAQAKSFSWARSEQAIRAARTDDETQCVLREFVEAFHNLAPEKT